MTSEQQYEAYASRAFEEYVAEHAPTYPLTTDPFRRGMQGQALQMMGGGAGNDG